MSKLNLIDSMAKPKEILEIEDVVGRLLNKSRFFTQNGHIKSINLNGLNIKNINFLTNYKSLKILALDDNDIVDISPFSNLNNFTSLSIENNKVNSIVPLLDLQFIEYINLNNNNIKDISCLNFKQFSKTLQLITMGGNFINKIPKGYYLDLRKRMIESFYRDGHLTPYYYYGNYRNNSLYPKLLSNFKSYFKSTYLEKIAVILSQFKEGTKDIGNHRIVDDFMYIHIATNFEKLIEPEIYIFNQRHNEILNYYKELEKKRANLKEVKVLFLGDGSAGKTTLMKRLLGDIVSAKESETDGIVIEKELLDDIQVNYWDFGGQEIQHNTHQFFLTENSIYVLVLDNRREEQPEYWLEYIKSLGAESPVIVVSNKIDDDQHSIEKFDPSYLKEKYPFIHSFHKISALHGINTEHLQKQLQELIRNYEFPAFGESWIKIKEFVEHETVLEKNYITSETYHAFCKEIQSVSSAESVLKWLRSIGKVSYYHKNLTTKHFYILNPEWLTYAVYKIILSEQTIQKNGNLHINDFESILKILPSAKTKKQYEYKTSDFAFLLEMMKEYDLCYTADNQHIIIPSAIKISYQTNFKVEENTLSFYFQYLDFLPPAIFSRLLVKLYPKKKGDAVWRTGIELFDEDTKSYALLRADKAEKRIYVYVNGERRVEFFQQIRSQIIDLNRLFPKMRYEQRIPLKSKILSDQSVDYEELINSMLDNLNEYYHAKTRELFNISELLAKIEPQEKTEQFKEFMNTINVNVSPTFNNNPTFNNVFKTDTIVQSQLEELKEYLMDLDELAEKNEIWKKALVEALSEDALRKALNEFNRLEDATEKEVQKTSKDYLNRTYRKLKDLKDVVGIVSLPAEIATKFPKMLEMWDGLMKMIQ